MTKQRCDESLATLASGGVDTPLDMLLLERPGLDDGSIGGQWRALASCRLSESSHLIRNSQTLACYEQLLQRI